MLSILTNFGCHFACSYCVYRDNKINIPFTNIDTFGWIQLEEELKKHKGEEVSISGGGDPLYNYDESNNRAFYDKLFALLKKYVLSVRGKSKNVLKESLENIQKQSTQKSVFN